MSRSNGARVSGATEARLRAAAAPAEPVLMAGAKRPDSNAGVPAHRCTDAERPGIAPVRRGCKPSPPVVCAECGKPKDHPRHMQYGNDLDNPLKHEFTTNVSAHPRRWSAAEPA